MNAGALNNRSKRSGGIVGASCDRGEGDGFAGRDALEPRRRRRLTARGENLCHVCGQSVRGNAANTSRARDPLDARRAACTAKITEGGNARRDERIED